jgi:formylglycine-generating enzyme required for sulfatase activity
MRMRSPIISTVCVFLCAVAAFAQRPSSAQGPQLPRPNAGPKSFRNQMGIEMVWIPAGSFSMGSTDAEVRAAYDDTKTFNPQAQLDWFQELPRHQVTIRNGFYMGKYEVTQGQWRAVMGTTVEQQVEKAGPSWSSRGETGDNYPMYYVSWNEAQDFIEKLNAMNDGYLYRLPTEAEWEYACRAGTTTAFAFGNSLSSDQANVEGVHRKGTMPVGSFQPNAWGLYDMHGNVYEWVQDDYHDSYNGAPSDGSAWLTSGDRRVVRGGSWGNASNLRSATRHPFTPGTRTGSVGFRVAAVARTR